MVRDSLRYAPIFSANAMQATENIIDTAKVSVAGPTCEIRRIRTGPGRVYTGNVFASRDDVVVERFLGLDGAVGVTLLRV